MKEFLVYAVPLAQAVIGAFLVMWLRNDTNELGGRITRSVWTIAATAFALFLIVFPIFGFIAWWKLAAVTVFAMALFLYTLTAPHGQTLRGPHQDIPANEDDPVFELACFITDHDGGAGDTLGWPAWLWYNFIRYVAPCILMGAVLHSWILAAAGVLIVAFYWPIAFIPAVRAHWDTRFFGAWWCGFWLFLGL